MSRNPCSFKTEDGECEFSAGHPGRHLVYSGTEETWHKNEEWVNEPLESKKAKDIKVKSYRKFHEACHFLARENGWVLYDQERLEAVYANQKGNLYDKMLALGMKWSNGDMSCPGGYWHSNIDTGYEAKRKVGELVNWNVEQYDKAQAIKRIKSGKTRLYGVQIERPSIYSNLTVAFYYGGNKGRIVPDVRVDKAHNIAQRLMVMGYKLISLPGRYPMTLEFPG